MARKSNEITAIPIVERPVDQALVTIDAMGCQTRSRDCRKGRITCWRSSPADVADHAPGSVCAGSRDALRDALRDADHCFEQLEKSGRLVVQRAGGRYGRVVRCAANCKMLATVESLRVVGGKSSDLERRYYTVDTSR
ncbi:MAG: hypothetical protein IPJ50_03825 [Betaproteobacteria bacterium]|nr:hypothetical protein [Betaproteobacteria bacterium]